jgi:hypothetical protein
MPKETGRYYHRPVVINKLLDLMSLAKLHAVSSLCCHGATSLLLVNDEQEQGRA